MNTGTLTYNGKNSLTDFGVYVTGSGSFDAAELDFDKYENAGRNGDLIIPKNRYKNIQVSYPAFIPKAFMNGVQNVRNWMRSSKGYARLEDTYDMTHYRLGLANGVQSFEPANRNDASNFQLNFDCRPERFLKSGETPLSIQPEAHTYSGDIVSFENVAVDDMTKATVTLTPKQSLNGYDHPWPAGGGKNKIDPNDLVAGFLGANGAINTQDATRLEYSSANYIEIPTGTTAISFGYNNLGSDIANRWSAICLFDESHSCLTRYTAIYADANAGIGARAGIYITTYPTAKYVKFSTRTYGHGLDGCYLVFGTAIDTSFAPYSNICPISGYDSATLNIGATYPTEDHSYPVSFSSYGTVYGGTYDWVTGKLTVTWAKKSFRWGDYTSTSDLTYYTRRGFPLDAKPIYPPNTGGQISTIAPLYVGYSKDALHFYCNADGANGQCIMFLPIGTDDNTTFDVVYELATPLEYTLTPTQIQTLLGLNNVWSDGSVEIAYADPFNVENPTFFDARPLFEITNPAANDVLSVNSIDITFTTGYTGTVVIDCETMNCYAGLTNTNYLISATYFPVLTEGMNIVTWSGSGSCKMTPRWWEL